MYIDENNKKSCSLEIPRSRNFSKLNMEFETGERGEKLRIRERREADTLYSHLIQSTGVRNNLGLFDLIIIQ